MASIAYWEQVGVKRQLGGIIGEMNSWYNLTNAISGALKIITKPPGMTRDGKYAWPVERLRPAS
jgi:hypothetical protein